MAEDEDGQTAPRYVRALVARLVALARGFFARIGVDERGRWIGKQPPWNVADQPFLSVDDMARFGITGMQSPADYPDRDVSGCAAKTVYLDLQ